MEGPFRSAVAERPGNAASPQALDEARSLGLSWYQFPLIRYVLAYRPHDSGGLDGVAESIKDLPRRVTRLFDR